MASDSKAAVADLARLAFRLDAQVPRVSGMPISPVSDPLELVMGASVSPQLYGTPEHSNVVAALERDPELALLHTREGEHEPFFLFEGGGSRSGLAQLSLGMLDAARRQQLLAGGPDTEDGFVGSVIQNLDELKRVTRGDRVRVTRVFGLVGVSLPAGTSLPLPWGTLSPTPPVVDQHAPAWSHQPSTAMITSRYMAAVQVTRDPSPDPLAFGTDQFSGEMRLAKLVPLAFALATANDTPCAPLVGFRSTLSPFLSGYASSSPVLPPWTQTRMLEPADLEELAHWAELIEAGHHQSMDVAAGRVVTAITLRPDPSDALIDAVTAWESLVGTRAETVFRVTAALSKLLAASDERAARRKSLGKIYDTRSRLVHGEEVEPQRIASHSVAAIEVALSAMRAIYERGDEWGALTSTARSDRLILGD